MNEFGAMMGDIQTQMNTNPNMTEAEQNAMMILCIENAQNVMDDEV